MTWVGWVVAFVAVLVFDAWAYWRSERSLRAHDLLYQQILEEIRQLIRDHDQWEREREDRLLRR